MCQLASSASLLFCFLFAMKFRLIGTCFMLLSAIAQVIIYTILFAGALRWRWFVRSLQNLGYWVFMVLILTLLAVICYMYMTGLVLCTVNVWKIQYMYITCKLVNNKYVQQLHQIFRNLVHLIFLTSLPQSKATPELVLNVSWLSISNNFSQLTKNINIKGMFAGSLGNLSKISGVAFSFNTSLWKRL